MHMTMYIEAVPCHIDLHVKFHIAGNIVKCHVTPGNVY